MRTFWINGEDYERRMTRLAPPPNNSSNTSSNKFQPRGGSAGGSLSPGATSTRSSLKRYTSPPSEKDAPLVTRADPDILSNGYVSLRDIESEKDSSNLRNIRCNSVDFTTSKNLQLTKNPRSLPLQRFSLDNECMSSLVGGTRSLPGGNCFNSTGHVDAGDDVEDWNNRSVMSAEGQCFHDEASPLLRISSQRDRSHRGGMANRRSLSGETTVWLIYHRYPKIIYLLFSLYKSQKVTSQSVKRHRAGISQQGGI